MRACEKLLAPHNTSWKATADAKLYILKMTPIKQTEANDNWIHFGNWTLFFLINAGTKDLYVMHQLTSSDTLDSFLLKNVEYAAECVICWVEASVSLMK